LVNVNFIAGDPKPADPESSAAPVSAGIINTPALTNVANVVSNLTSSILSSPVAGSIVNSAAKAVADATPAAIKAVVGELNNLTMPQGNIDAPITKQDIDEKFNFMPLEQEWEVPVDLNGEPMCAQHSQSWWNPFTWWNVGNRHYFDFLAFKEHGDGRYAFEDDIKCVRENAQLLDVTVGYEKARYFGSFQCTPPEYVETTITISGVLFQTCCAKFKAGPLPDLDRMNNFITHLESVNCVRGIQELEFAVTGNKVTRNLSNVIRNTVSMARDCIAAGIIIHDAVFQTLRLIPSTGNSNSGIAQPMSQFLFQAPVNCIRWLLNQPVVQHVASAIVASAVTWLTMHFLSPILGINLPLLQA
jgi:hypothetical protein